VPVKALSDYFNCGFSTEISTAGKYFPHLSKIALRTVVNQTLSWLHDWTLVQQFL